MSHRKVEQDLSLSSKEIDKPVHRHKRPPLIPRHQTAKILKKKKNKKLLKKYLTKLFFFFLYFLDIKEQRLQMDTRQTCLLYLATISFFDLRERRIPNSITFGFFSLLILKDIFTAPSKISVSLACSAFFFTVFLAAAAATKGIGMGDIKLAAAIGYCSGFFKTLCSFIFASLGGIIFFMAMRLFNKGTSRIPFAPFAAAGYLLSELVRGEAA